MRFQLIGQHFFHLQPSQTLYRKQIPIDPSIWNSRTLRHQFCNDLMGSRSGIVILKASGIGCHACIETSCQMLCHLHRQKLHDLIQDLTRSGSLSIQAKPCCITGIGNVMVDTQIHPAAVWFLQPA